MQNSLQSGGDNTEMVLVYSKKNTEFTECTLDERFIIASSKNYNFKILKRKLRLIAKFILRL